jgi:hypothetical protein
VRVARVILEAPGSYPQLHGKLVQFFHFPIGDHVTPLPRQSPAHQIVIVAQRINVNGRNYTSRSRRRALAKSISATTTTMNSTTVPAL